MSERLTDEELSYIGEAFPTHMGEPETSVLVQRLLAEVQLRREKERMHDYNHCIDCSGPLVQCTCQPDCPGGMCARNCHLGQRSATDLSRDDIATLAEIRAEIREFGMADDESAVDEAPRQTRALVLLDRLLEAHRE